MANQNPSIRIVETETVRGVKVPFVPPKEVLSAIRQIKENVSAYKGKSILYNLPQDHVETTWRNRYSQYLTDNKLDGIFKLSIRQMKGYKGFTLQLRVKD
jgi:hypothetical protein